MNPTQLLLALLVLFILYQPNPSRLKSSQPNPSPLRNSGVLLLSTQYNFNHLIPSQPNTLDMFSTQPNPTQDFDATSTQHKSSQPNPPSPLLEFVILSTKPNPSYLKSTQPDPTQPFPPSHFSSPFVINPEQPQSFDATSTQPNPKRWASSQPNARL